MGRRLIVLIMSVGTYDSNFTAQYLCKIGGKENIVVCLPKAKKDNAASYEERGIKVYVYDQDKYISDDFEFYGFRPRNCGGVGRQGIAEATEKISDDSNIILELDDDTSAILVGKSIGGAKNKYVTIRDFSDLERVVNAEYEFTQKTGIEIAGATGASIPGEEQIVNKKIFNNFIMYKGNKRNFSGFAALCSDDYRFNVHNNLLNNRPMVSCKYVKITFHQNQGDRKDGNAPLYNSDFSWKKSFALKMVMPTVVEQRIVEETNRVLFRENIKCSKLYPPICLSDENGNIVGRV